MIDSKVNTLQSSYVYRKIYISIFILFYLIDSMLLAFNSFVFMSLICMVHNLELMAMLLLRVL